MSDPQREQIARRAYEIYLQRGGKGGQDLDDWLQAEREIEESREKAAAKTRKPGAKKTAAKKSTAKTPRKSTKKSTP
jgi:topoisomerase IA-like protein